MRPMPPARHPLRPEPERAALALWARPVHATSSMVESTADDYLEGVRVSFTLRCSRDFVRVDDSVSSVYSTY